MPETVSLSDFELVVLHRTAVARERRFKQDGIAEILGIEQNLYAKYENRTLLPARFIHTFCVACGVDAMDLFAPPHAFEIRAAREWMAAKPKRTRKKKKRVA